MMDYYMKIEVFRSGVSGGKGVTIYDADNLADALRKASKMIENYPTTLRSEPPSFSFEERITIAPLIQIPT